MQKARGATTRQAKGWQNKPKGPKLKYGFIFTHSTGTRFVLCLRKGFYLWKRAFSKILRSAEWSKDASRYSKTRKMMKNCEQKNNNKCSVKQQINNVNSGKWKVIQIYQLSCNLQDVHREHCIQIAIATFMERVCVLVLLAISDFIVARATRAKHNKMCCSAIMLLFVTRTQENKGQLGLLCTKERIRLNRYCNNSCFNFPLGKSRYQRHTSTNPKTSASQFALYTCFQPGWQ